MSRRAVGLTGQNFDFYTQACPSTGGGSCQSGGALYIDSSTSGNPGEGQKFVIVHEMGHNVGYKKNGNASANGSYDAPVNNCYTVSTRSHEMNSKEYQSSGANEGYAHYYAAVAFNQTDQTNCWFEYYKTVDWNLDTTLDDQTTDCENGPMTGIDSYDYLGDECTGTLTNRSTEYDWLRFLWDLDTDQGVTTTTIFNIWDDANPNSWNDTGDGTGTNYPATRLRDAANTNSVLSKWDNEDNQNGVHR